MSAFAQRLASPFADSRRRRFLSDMLRGLVISGQVHLTKVARAIGSGCENVHPVEKRLSRHLASKHWDPRPLADALLHDSAARVTDDSLLVGDLTDLAKYYAKKLEGLGRVHDGSDPEKRTAPGYMLFEAYVRVGRWQSFPLVLEPLKVYSGAATSENRELWQHVQRIQQATGGKGTWLWDRGADRDELMLPWLGQGVAFVIRQRGDRHVVGSDGRVQAETAWAAEWQPRTWPRPWPRRGYTTCGRVYLPEVLGHELLLVVHWRRPGSEPLLLLVSPRARRPGRQTKWFAKAYRRR